MKKCLVLCLCLSLLTGCVALPAFWPEGAADQAARPTAAPAVTTEPVFAGTARPTAETTPLPVPGVTLVPVPAYTLAPTATATSQPTATPLQTYTGVYFRFDVPKSWLRADVEDGAYFYPDLNDIQHSYLIYQEAANDLKLTETSLDIALMFSSPEAIAAMVAGALTNSGMTNFQLSPVRIEKTRLNGITCYRGASDVVVDGERYDFEGRIFLRGSKMVLLIWVGDQVKYAEGLKTVYDSFQSLR